VGYYSVIICAGRCLYGCMGRDVASEVFRCMIRIDLTVLVANVLLLGFTFKENCPDFRNTRIIDIYKELRAFDIAVEVYDPWANAAEVKHEYGIDRKSVVEGKEVESVRRRNSDKKER